MESQHQTEKKNHYTITKNDWLILSEEIVAVYVENRAKQIIIKIKNY